jgi:hypothetical protein
MVQGDGRKPAKANAAFICLAVNSHEALIAEHKEWSRKFAIALLNFLQGDTQAINDLAHDMTIGFDRNGEPCLESKAIAAGEVKG